MKSTNKNKESLSELSNVHKNIHILNDELQGVINAYQSLIPELSNEFKDKITDLESQLTNIRWQNSEDYRQTHFKKIMVPYLFSTLNRMSAIVYANTTRNILSHKELFECHMTIEALTNEDIKDVANDYHDSVSKMIRLQKDNKATLKLHSVSAEDVSEYKRLCESITLNLDRAASEVFRRKISTPANFDVKETNPRQFLGTINVGFEQTVANLTRVIGHEGPFGHNTHMSLSKESQFYQMFRHQTEGLAILGEILALESQKYDIPIRDLMLTKRIMMDSVYATYEKLAFSDGLSLENIAKELDSDFFPKERILNNLDDQFKGSRAKIFSFGAIPYYAGSKIILNTYNEAIKTIDKMFDPQMDKELLRQNLLLKMYTGHKPARLVQEDIQLYLKYLNDQNNKNKSNGNGVSLHLNFY